MSEVSFYQPKVLRSEEPVIETPPAATTPAVETPVAPPAEPAPAAQPSGEPAPATWEMNLQAFNQKYGEGFKTEDEFRSSLKQAKEVPVLREQLTAAEVFKQQNEELRQYLDPGKWFANEDIMRHNEMLKKYPNEDAGFMRKLLTTDETKANPIELLAMAEQRKQPHLSDAIARKLVLDRFGIESEDALNTMKTDDPDGYELAMAKIGSQSIDFKNEIKKLKDVPMPQKIDFEAEKANREATAKAELEKRTQQLRPIVERTMESFKDINIEFKDDKGEVVGTKTFNVTDEAFKKDALEMLQSQWLANDWHTDADSFQNARQYVENLYLITHKSEVFNWLRNQVIAEQKDAQHALIHNDQSLSGRQAPPEALKSEADRFAAAQTAPAKQKLNLTAN